MSYYETIRNRNRWESTRAVKAARIAALLGRQRGDLSHDLALEIGCASCGMTRVFQTHFRRTIALDVDRTALRGCEGSHEVVVATATALPFKDGTFDVLIANHTMEYVPDVERSLTEMDRLLRPEGAIYLAAVNALQFLPARLLPQRLGARYIGAVHFGEVNIGRPYTYLQWKRLLRQYAVSDWTMEAARSRDPSIPASFSWLAKRLPGSILRLLGPVYPSWVFILNKGSRSVPASAAAANEETVEARSTQTVRITGTSRGDD